MKDIFNHSQTYKKISCDALCNRLVFFGGIAAYCSNGNPAQKRSYPTLQNNFKDILNIDFSELKNKIIQDKRNLLNGLIYDSCKNCPNLYEKKYESSFFDNPEISYIQFSDYGLCNSKCVYCNSWTNTKYENGKYSTISGEIDSYDIMPIIKGLIEHDILTKNTTIDFAGGEPTIYRHFNEALKYLLDFGIKQFFIFSNSIIYSKPIEEGLEKGVVTLTVSIDAGTQNIHQKVKGVETYNDIYKNLIKYVNMAKYKENVISKYVVVPGINDDEKEIELWINKSKEIGIKKLIINADNRIFEKQIDKNVIKKFKELLRIFEQTCYEKNIKTEIYSNMQYIKKYEL